MNYDSPAQNQSTKIGNAPPRPTSEVERLNQRIEEATRNVNMMTSRVANIADYLVGPVPSNPVPPGGGLAEVSSNTQHFIVDLERALTTLNTTMSRLDNQGS